MFVQWLKDSSHTVVFTGAGMSTESGLPDFRSAAQGLWKDQDPMQLASVHALENNREECVEFYRARIAETLKHKPHRGHEILAGWEKQGLVQAIITQNVDGYHYQAGSSNVIELHGTRAKVFCMTCRREFPSGRYLDVGGAICDCGGFLHPSVVLFGEYLSAQNLQRADEEASKADLFIVLGSSLQVSPANQYPLLAKQNGAKLVIVNMEPTVMDHYADLVINNRKIGDILAEVEEIYNLE
jgi:NAD-dependent deacetylase